MSPSYYANNTLKWYIQQTVLTFICKVAAPVSAAVSALRALLFCKSSFLEMWGKQLLYLLNRWLQWLHYLASQIMTILTYCKQLNTNINPYTGISLPYTLYRVQKKNRFYPRDAMLARVFAIATCLSVCLSHAGIVPSRAKAGSWNVHQLMAPWL